MPTTDALLSYLFDGQPHPLAAAFDQWLASKRFRAWAETYRDKIRKKLRGTSDAEAARDLRFELETGFRLVQERRFTVVYEHYGADKGRNPDFTVTFGSLIFNVEVTRLRPSSICHPERSEGSLSPSLQDNQDSPPLNAQAEATRLADTVATKLRQLPPGSVGLLVIVAEDAVAETVDFPHAMHRLKTQAEQGESAVLARHRFRDTADFFRYYLRLSGVLLRGTWDNQPTKPLTLWANPQAKHPLLANLRAILNTWGDP